MKEGGNDFEVIDSISYALYVAEGCRHKCPRLRIKIVGQEIEALIDAGCEMSILNENLYNKLRHAGLQCLELQTQNVNLSRTWLKDYFA